jgi:hypothetical protein
MTIRELITELQKLDQDIPVCGQSETTTWDIDVSELVPEENVMIWENKLPNIKIKKYPQALILGYKH